MMVQVELQKRGIVFATERFDSNNAWGFGGADGNRFVFHIGEDRYCITVATAYFRHLPPERFIKMTKNGDTMFDLLTSAGNKALIKFFNTI